jgi:hypothetical protein
MAARINASNDSNGYNQQLEYIKFTLPAGDITSTATIVQPCPVAGTVVNVVGCVGEVGVDATNPLQMQFVATKDDASDANTSLSATDAVITKAATGGSPASTAAAGTGITQWVKSATPSALAVVAGNVLKIAFTITRTASPSDEFADVCAYIVVAPTVS